MGETVRCLLNIQRDFTNYLAALRDSTLYTGLVGGALQKRDSGYATMSWDANDDLWTAHGEQIVMFRAAVSLRQPSGTLTPVPLT